MSTTPDLLEPQIAAARAQAWRQTGDPLLTLDAARTWLEEFGLVLFAPISATLGVPAPSLVEATLGAPRTSATLAEMQIARGLTARMVGEGSALPLNLLGGAGDLPDFVVSAQVFPFVFTLRGDKGWKRPPETVGTVRVTPLGLRVYELLAEKGALPIAEMVTEIGREVTESAIARALSELWQLLRVIPVAQQGEGPTLWELTTTRFLKAVKAGANAGQPTALSGLVSLYLTQSLVVTEEDVAGFLSPLTARSRIREVLHGLSAARQLAEGVVLGKTVVYVPEMLPDFAALVPPALEGQPEGEGMSTGSGESAESAESIETSEPAGPAEKRPASDRIRRFGEGGGPGTLKDRPLRGKPLRRETSGEAGAAGAERPRRGGTDRAPRAPRERTGAGAERRALEPRAARAPRTGPPTGSPNGPREGAGAGFERRPRPAADRPSYSKPWDEERGSRPPRAGGGDSPSSASRGPRPPRRDEGAGGERPRRPFGAGGAARPPRREGDRPPFRSRDASATGESGGESRRPFAGGGGDRPARPYRERSVGGDRPPRRVGGGAAGERPERSDRGDRTERPKRDRPEGGGRPFTPRAGGDRPFRPRTDSREGGTGDRRPPAGGGARSRGGDRPSRFAPRGEGDRGGQGGSRSDAPKAFRSDAPKAFRSDAPKAFRSDAPRAPRGGPAGEGRPFRAPRSADGAGARGGFRPGPGTGPRGGGGARPSFGSSSGPKAGAGPKFGNRPGNRPGGGPGAGPRSGPRFGAGGAGSRPAGAGPRPPFKRAGGKPPSGAPRAPRKPRPEDEA